MMKTLQELETNLESMRDQGYRRYQAALMPDIDKEAIIGIRVPVLRDLAKEMAGTPLADEFLNALPHKYYDENNLHAYLIERVAKDFDTAIRLTDAFLPHIDNWATCDTFSPRVFQKNLNRLYEKSVEWMQSDHPFTVRYGIVVQLRYFLTKQFRPEMLDFMAQIHTDEYYVNMAIAWYYSYALIEQREATIGYFLENKLDRWIHNKALQKAVESRRLEKEDKLYLAGLKRPKE